MASLKELSKIVDDTRFLQTFTAPRPERLDVRTVAGTKGRLDAIRELGLGMSRSEVAHIALQVGLYALETSMGDGPE